MVSVTVYNEFVHEREDPEVEAVYPDGIHAVLAECLREAGHEVTTATLEEEAHGLSERVLADTDVLLWWGHAAHDEVREDVVDRVVARVREGMGFVPLHSAHYSKPFVRLMGTSCSLKWRDEAERERLWVLEPGHPVADGLPESFALPRTETYGERFDVPQPDALVFCSWFEGGEVFRSGCAYRRGAGRVFYFRPGHEAYPIYRDEQVRQVIRNAVAWAAPGDPVEETFGNTAPVE